MRIIAGSAKRRTIIAPKGQNTRPTQDYVREALFNIIQLKVDGSNCLDLFAGSGALGLEAISRGANLCVFCDKSYNAIVAIKNNISSLKFEDSCHIVKADWKQAIAYIKSHDIKLDLVFIDPPYAFKGLNDIANHLVESDVLKSNAMLVFEKEKQTEAIDNPHFELGLTRQYGICVLDIYSYRKDTNN